METCLYVGRMNARTAYEDVLNAINARKFDIKATKDKKDDLVSVSGSPRQLLLLFEHLGWSMAFWRLQTEAPAASA